MNGSGLVCLKWHPLGYQATSQRYCSLTNYGGALLGGPIIPPYSSDQKWITKRQIREEGQLSSLGLQQEFLFRGSAWSR